MLVQYCGNRWREYLDQETYLSLSMGDSIHWHMRGHLPEWSEVIVTKTGQYRRCARCKCLRLESRNVLAVQSNLD
jgi:hypothetical protein